jgi:hypothetical protein
VASREGAEHLADLKKQRDGLDRWIDEVERQIQENEEKEQGSYRLPKELEDREELRRRIDEAMEELKREKRTSRNRHEPEARMMPCEGRKRFAYNAQAVVDEASGMIVAEGVFSEPCDQGLLVGMLDESEKNLGRVAQDTVADKGYRRRQLPGATRCWCICMRRKAIGRDRTMFPALNIKQKRIAVSVRRASVWNTRGRVERATEVCCKRSTDVTTASNVVWPENVRRISRDAKWP